MSSGWARRLPRTLVLRVGLWYAAVFASSVTALVLIAYVLLASALQQRDREIVVATLRAYADEYARGGLRAVAAAVDRLTDPDDAAWLETPAGDRPATLEVASARMRDGTLLQVGKSTESRDDLLGRFKQVLLLVTGIVLAAGLAGGLVLTRSAMQPVGRLAATVRTIIATGRTDALTITLPALQLLMRRDSTPAQKGDAP